MRYVKSKLWNLILCAPLVFLGFTACLEAPKSDDTSDSASTKATKSAVLTLSAVENQAEAADISSENSAFQFGSRAINSTYSVIFTLTNGGEVPATKMKASFLTLPFSFTGGSYPGQGATCGKILEAGGSCTVSLSYSPTEMATTQDILKLSYHNGKTTRIFEKQLTGSGYSVPAITLISTNHSGLTGGATLTIVGTHIFTASTVTVGGTLCVGSATPPTTYSCTLPAHAAGTVDIVLTNSDGKATTLSQSLNYYAPPVVTSISPSSGYTAGGQTLTLSGTGFRSGATVTVKNESCGTLSVDSATQITCITATSGSGTGDVVVTNDDMQASTLSNAFTFVGTSASWTAMTTVGAPSTTGGRVTLWTGSRIIVWGGSGNSGGQYDPLTDSWTATNTAGAPNGGSNQVGVWSGSKMLVAGDGSGSILGGQYDPVANTWTAMTTTGWYSYRYYLKTVWTGKKMFVWGGDNGVTSFNTGGLYDPDANTWSTVSTTGAPAIRHRHSVIWTGGRIVVWGGAGINNSPVHNTGGQYDPETNTWTNTSTTGVNARMNHVAVWTGGKMIVWSGSNTNTGSIYDPYTNSWTTVATTNAPSARTYSGGVWTGRNMLVWGGINGSSFNSGGLYDPYANTWTTLSVTGAPSARNSNNAIFDFVWTGSKVVIFGAYNGTSFENTGGIYTPASDPLTGTWTAMTTTGAPTSRRSAGSVWTGSKMIIWGGYAGTYTNTGALYDPVTDSWSATTTTGAPFTRAPSLNIWTGRKYVMWGGGYTSSVSNGGQYDPIADSWTVISTTGIPSDAAIQTVPIWTGSKIIVWGGDSGYGANNNGAIYDPEANTWSAMATTNAPTIRRSYAAVWTGGKMVVWAGSGSGNTFVNTGGSYDPIANEWSSMNVTGSPSARTNHAAVWTGSKMIIWGDNYHSNTGGIYDPYADNWTTTSTTNAPTGRKDHKSIWTGSKMLVWGGSNASSYFNSGGMFDPITNTWTSTSITNAPTRRSFHNLNLTGSQILIWGGVDGSSTNFNTGGLFTP